MSEFTPGPWKFVGPPANAKPDQQGDRLIVAENGDHIAESFQYRGDDLQDIETSIANARLIAAAPELLGLAEGYLCLLGALDRDGMAPDGLAEIVSSVIAKAKGTS